MTPDPRMAGVELLVEDLRRELDETVARWPWPARLVARIVLWRRRGEAMR